MLGFYALRWADGEHDVPCFGKDQVSGFDVSMSYLGALVNLGVCVGTQGDAGLSVGPVNQAGAVKWLGLGPQT